ncbi:hypothetical protein [Mycoavidus cysteinexigens]|nr:hypothetical protein [Mycoavidus cysteinexigens]GAM52404.1 hypothetical protein EBME_0867 [bacterium endosymbiont of Mortierella elongata FMR23-6]
MSCPSRDLIGQIPDLKGTAINPPPQYYAPAHPRVVAGAHYRLPLPH